MRVTCNSTEMVAEAAVFAKRLERGQHATLATLSGELGAGKTTFAQGIAKALGITEQVTSPTFVIEKIYQLQDQKFERLIHIDAYRLKSAHELRVLGWEELLRDPDNLIVLEWPERVAEVIPKGAIRITFDIHDDERIITIHGEEELPKSSG